jgi:hypothetical protein
MKNKLNKLKEQLKSKPYVFLSVPAVLCFVTFLSNLITSLKDGNIDNAEYHALLSTADGFETVILVLIILFTNDNKKLK